MPLESLLTLVEKLRERIDVHGPALRQNEMQTRYALIDPLLRELGWDTGNPDLVIPEYKTDDGSADYALLRNGKPIMMVEAKKMDTPLPDRVLTQGLTYCQMQGTRYCSVTDGRRWEIYDTHNTGPKDEKRIVQFDLKDQSATETCLKALTLWGLRVSGHVATGPTPVVGPTHNPPDSPEPPPPQPTPPSLDEHKWQLLSKYQEPHAPKPIEVRFPDNSVVPVKAWKSILVEVAKWLEKNKLLTENHCPISVPRKSGRTKLYVVNTKAVHSNGKPFRDPTRVGAFYVANNSTIAVANAIQIIEYVGQNPAQFKAGFLQLRTKPAPS